MTDETPKADEEQGEQNAEKADEATAETAEVEAAAEAAKAAEEAAAAAEEVAAPEAPAAPAAEEKAEDASEDDAEPASDEGDGAAPAAAAERPAVSEVIGWAGYKLDEMGGASIGRVDGAYVDEAGGEAEWLLVRLGRFGHHTLVPCRYAVGAAERVWVPFARDVIRRAPRVKAGTPLTKDEEAALLAHYGVAAPTGRSADIAEREAGAVTARPAS